jgi:hypothetical protein
MCLLFTPHVINKYGEPQWNNIDRRKLKNLEKYLTQYHTVHHKHRMD